jgi:DNA (cytosine-5)-methyltransferase 1
MCISMLTSVELFSGAGGLALGVAAAGFEHQLLLEYNRHACATLRENRQHFGPSCVIHEGDVKVFDFAPFAGIDLLAAGAPCQPFSIGGKHKAHADERNLFPQVFRAQREMRPKAVLIENVRGLLRPNLAEFVEFIELQLAYPTVLADDPLDPDGWQFHLHALRTAQQKKPAPDFRYVVRKALLNAADFGVPQRRERVFFVAVRSDLGTEWEPPKTSHSRSALDRAMRVSGSYWKKHGIPSKPAPNGQPLLGIEQRDQEALPWTTVRDALAGLPKPVVGKESEGVHNHFGQPGARSYPGHTGSPLDAPAKTLKAGVHGVPGGENMLRNPNGTVRYFTVREAARIQTFPDQYVFRGAWSEAMRQIGNAVPVSLAAAVGGSIRRTLEKGNREVAASLTPTLIRPGTRRARTQRAPAQPDLQLSAHFQEDA